MSLAFLPWAAALSLTLGTPALVRSFLLPTASTRPEDRRPSKPLFFATWLVTVLPIWAIAPFSWAALSEALYASWRLGESVWSGRSTLGKVWLVWASIEAAWSVYTAILARSVQPPLAVRPEPDPKLKSMFEAILSAGAGSSPPEPEPGRAQTADKPFSDAGVDEVKEAEQTLETVLDDGVPFEPQLAGQEGRDQPAVIERLAVDDERAVEFRERMRTWFFHADWAAIKRDNMLDWIAWSSFRAPSHTALTTPAQREALEHALDLMERRTGTVFPPGRDEKVRVMRLTLDKVHVHHRPLAAYLFTELVNAICELDYKRRGMERLRFGAVEYLVRTPASWSSAAKGLDPLIYIHGLGFGHLQNHKLLVRLLDEFPDRPVIVPQQENISMTVFGEKHLRPVGRAEVIASLRLALLSLGFYRPTASEGDRGGVTIISHSNGSTSHAWILKDAPELTTRNIFLDPVVFCLWEGDVCFNFVYRQPRSAIELLIAYWIAGELGIANTISRYFDWSHNTLFLADVPHAPDPKRFAIFLGGKDAILSAPRVRDYLEKHGAGECVLWEEHAPHGAVLFEKAKLSRVIEWIRQGDESSAADAANLID